MIRLRSPLLASFALALWLASCSAPRSLPPGPTPIPTLIPATELPGALGSPTAPAVAIQSSPARPPSAALGQPIYATHCARCHGDDGKGVVPGARDFTDLDFVRGESPASFYATVADGRGEMPAFGNELTSDQRWDAVFYVWRFSTNSETLALGQTIFQANCAVCHGSDGTGKVLGAADFTDLRVVDDQAPRDFYLTVTQGKGSMPAWQGRLSQDERWAVIDYLRTFSYDPSLPGAGAPLATATSAMEEVACDPTFSTQTNPFSWDDAAAIEAGRTIYDKDCAACHASNGSGALPGAPDFSSAGFPQELRNDPAEHLCVVAEGEGAMPAWKDTLSSDQMWQVLTYIGTLGQ
ncbi:MAG TPA: c-type cytochrome [Anaerolineales bacterium]|nr:c-type cytochrome [Anaerolineales bacterium]